LREKEGTGFLKRGAVQFREKKTSLKASTQGKNERAEKEGKKKEGKKLKKSDNITQNLLVKKYTRSEMISFGNRIKKGRKTRSLVGVPEHKKYEEGRGERKKTHMRGEKKS